MSGENDNEAPERGETVAAPSAPVTASQLRAEAARARAIAEELTRQAAEQAVAEEEARKPRCPQVMEGAPTYVTFTRYMNGREYAYAAVGWRAGRSVRWAVTGSEDRRFNWPALLQYVGEANWSTLRVVTDQEPILTPGGEPPVAEVMGRYGRVRGTEPVEDDSVVGIIVGLGDPRRRSPFTPPSPGGRGYAPGGIIRSSPYQGEEPNRW